MHTFSMRFVRRLSVLFLAVAFALPMAGMEGGLAFGSAPAPLIATGPNLIINGSFEHGIDPGTQATLAAGSTLLDGWTIINPGCCGVWYMGSAWQAEEGTRSLMLSTTAVGDPKSAAGVTQTFPTAPGQKYLLSFYQAGNPERLQPWAMQVQVGGQVSTFTDQPDAQASAQHMEWVQHVLTFTASAPHTTVTFLAYQTCCNVGIGLDNVQVHHLVSPVPPTPVAHSGATQAMPITGTVTLQVVAPALAAGSRQIVAGTAGKNAAVALIVDYPDGTQVVTSLKAGPDGLYTDTWAVPAGIHGSAYVLIDSAGKIARGTFLIRG